ncbi:hypothetical protein C8R46DRAFT_1124049 [Mycena filopes]|nr:hypothetical protein C8R46DRAFT_1124049 [Mycena filopes]
MDTLAQELIDCILEEVGPVPSSDLKSCSLVAKRFRSPSQRLLFRTVTIVLGRYRYKKLWCELSKAPRLGSYVRDLYVDIYDGATDAEYIKLAAEFTVLTNLRRLILLSSVSSWYSSSPRAFKTSLRSLLPQLQSVALNCDGVPVPLVAYLLAACEVVALLAGVHDGDAVPDGTESNWDPLETVIVRLDRLDLNYNPSRSPTLHNLLLRTGVESGFSHLRCLTMYPSGPQSLGAFEALVVQCPSQEHLVVSFEIPLLSQNQHAPAYRLPTLASLRFLTFEADLEEAEVPRCLMACIATLPAQTPNLEVLTFRFSAGNNSPYHWNLDPEEKADEALVNHPTLYEAHFALEVGVGSGGFVQRVRAQLPRSAVDGLLKFSAAMGALDRFTNMFGDPFLNNAEDLGYELDDSGSSVDEEEGSGGSDGADD